MVLFALLIGAVIAPVNATADAIQELLEREAPPPDWRDYLRHNPTSIPAPPLAASDEDMLEFWRWRESDDKPDQPTQLRLLEICERIPGEFGSVARFFSADWDPLNERLKQLHDRLRAAHTEDQNTIADGVQEWLMLNSGAFREELIATAQGKRNGSEAAQEEALQRLLRVDPQLAIARVSKRDEVGSAAHFATALGALLRGTAAAGSAELRATWIEKLKEIAGEAKETADARGKAVAALIKVDWLGRDEWFISLFRLPVIRPKYDFSYDPNPLRPLVESAPETWIPRLARFLHEKNEFARSNAAECLLPSHEHPPRRDALLPLLPWIANENWVRTRDKYGRLRLLQGLIDVQIPECADLLTKSVARARDAELAAMAEAIAHYKIGAAVAPLKKAASDEKNPYSDNYRAQAVRALLGLNAFATSELATGAREYAIAVAALPEEEWTGQAWEQIAKKRHALTLDAGHEICTRGSSSEAATKAVLLELAELGSKNPKAAAILAEAIVMWPTPSSYAETIRRLRSGEFSGRWLRALLEAKTEIATALRDAGPLEGAPNGVRAALLGDQPSIIQVLDANNRDTTRALLAAARLKRLPLPVERVGPLLDASDDPLSFAADRYLEALDTPAARLELQARARGKARILGYPAWGREISESEAKLHKIILATDGPDEIFALLSTGTWGGNGQRALLIKGDRAVVQREDGNGRTRTCEFDPDEMRGLREWIARRRIAELPPYDEGAADGIQWQYLHLRRDVGERVYMNNPPGGRAAPMVMPAITEPRPEPLIYGELTCRMRKLNEKPMKVSYRSIETLPGLRIVHEAENGAITRLSSENGKLRAGISIGQDEPLEWHEVKGDAVAKDFLPGEPPKQRGELEEKFNSTDEALTIAEGPFQGRELWAGTRERDKLDGLWLSKRAMDADLIAKGIFGHDPVICPGGEWIVIAKTFGTNMWAQPNGVVRINLISKEIIPVDLPPAENFDPLVWIAAHRRVLLYRQRDDARLLPPRDKPDPNAGPEQPEYWLLDPLDGKLQKVEGDFRPLRRLDNHSLQPTSRPNEFWSTIVEEDKSGKPTTIFGRYDAATFRFTECARFPEIYFDFWNTFVDDDAKRLWLAVNGDLLRVSLPASE